MDGGNSLMWRRAVLAKHKARMSDEYLRAIDSLNNLQTNAATLELLRQKGTMLNTQSLPEYRAHLACIGYKPQDLDKLNVIHIAGTKGKGSTSAFCESILRRYQIRDKDPGGLRPLKTGLFTSPHLQEVRERIRIDGAPIQKDLFAKYFFDVYNKLEENQHMLPENVPKKPMYFRFLAMVAFHCFLQEKVDVGVIEVGIGGEYDCTNVVEQPVVCGITALGFDHMPVLGYTLPEIARHKAGIIKKGRPVFTSWQPDDAMEVIKAHAAEMQASSCQEVSQDDISKVENLPLGLAGEHQKSNAALASILADTWLKSRSTGDCLPASVFDASGEVVHEAAEGLAKVRWPGRAQRYHAPELQHLDWFLDGAHTVESLQICATWFKSCLSTSRGPGRALIFNCTHGRNGGDLLKSLADLHKSLDVEGKPVFDLVVFCTNEPYKQESEKPKITDMINHTVVNDATFPVQHALVSHWNTLVGDDGNGKASVDVAASIEDAVDLVASRFVPSDIHAQVLVTGSLHLVGGMLAVLGASVE
ncbi:Mur ligase [Cladochytrium replicatum]|nr:Mur ligase [Cladochytrium replicatum]